VPDCPLEAVTRQLFLAGLGLDELNGLRKMNYKKDRRKRRLTSGRGFQNF